MKKKDQILLEEAYEHVKAAADRGSEIFFIEEQLANQIYLVPAIAYAMNAAAVVDDPNFNAQGNMAMIPLQKTAYPNYLKDNPELKQAMAACQTGLKSYFKGTPPKLNMYKIDDLNQSEAFGVGYKEGKKGLISYIGFQNPFWWGVFTVATVLNGDSNYRGKYEYFTKDGYYDKLTPEEARRITEKPQEQQYAGLAQQQTGK